MMTRLAQNESGAVLVFVGVTAAVVIGFGALAVDVGRMASNHTQLQAAVDAAALAGAGQLNRQDGALERARQAAADAVTNTLAFADGGTAVTLNTAATCTGAVPQAGDNCVRFLRSLPVDDADPNIDGTHVTTDATEAAFIEVRLPTATTAIFAGLIGDRRTVAPVARAVAGHHRLACEVPPLFICDDPNRDLTQMHGQQFRIVAQSSPQAPGNFGMLCPPNSQCGASSLRDMLASWRGAGCIEAYAVETEPGMNTGMLKAGFDVRFDSYYSQTQQMRGSPFAPPAANVTQGGVRRTQGQQCYHEQPATAPTVPLGRDSAFDANGVGNGIWDWSTYFAVNHGTGGGYPADWTTVTGLAPVGTPTRYDVYRYEIESGRIPERPSCYTGGTVTDNISYFPDRIRDRTLVGDRRLMTVAVLDCTGLSGRDTRPATQFTFMFLTEPFNDPEKAIYAEFLAPTDDALERINRDITQIYRR